MKEPTEVAVKCGCLHCGGSRKLVCRRGERFPSRSLGECSERLKQFRSGERDCFGSKLTTCGRSASLQEVSSARGRFLYGLITGVDLYKENSRAGEMWHSFGFDRLRIERPTHDVRVVPL